MKRLKTFLALTVVVLFSLALTVPFESQASDEWPSCRTNFDETCTSGSTTLPEGETIEWEISGERNLVCNNPGGCINQ